MRDAVWNWNKIAGGLFLSLTVVTLGWGLSSCTAKGLSEEISDAEVSFVEPSANTYSNDINFPFKILIHSNNKDITSQKSLVEIFESPNCDSSKMVSSRTVDADGLASAGAALEDGKVYSARVIAHGDQKIFQSACSPWISVDTQKPTAVTISYPASDNYTSIKEMLATWSAATDTGTSGLTDTPYRLRLYSQPTCAGSVEQTVDTVALQYTFTNLTHGLRYSVKATSVDKAGNESLVACSPYTEIDIYAPGFSLSDSTSSTGYSRVTSPQVQILNDAPAAYWCFTSDLNFLPTSYTDVCPGGSGTVNGWYTASPTTLPIGSGDGSKAFHLWIVRADGSLISANKSSAAITLDQTPPGSFSVVGVAGSTDVIYDAWLTSSGQPKVKWTAATDVVNYTVDIKTTTDTLVCSMSGLTGTGLTFVGCPVLTDGQTYKVHITAFDVALNPTSAPDFNFTVDRSPPGSFSIAGITGAGDIQIDGFVGTGNPTVNYGTAANSTLYKVRIDDTGGTNICTLGSKADQSGYFDYATESGVTCTGLVSGGSYKAYVSAFDDGQNQTQASNNGFAFKVDTVAPSLNLTTVPASPTSNTFANFVFTASDPLSGMDKVQCSLDGGSYLTCTSPHNLTGLGEGSHTLDVKAFDLAGNVATKSHTWTVDLTNPVLTIDSQPATYTDNPNISIAFHATDASGVAGYTCKIDAGSASACTSPLNVNLSQGSHTVIVRATDSVGYYDEKTVSFTVDTDPPVVTLTGVPANPSHGVTTGTVTFTASDVTPMTLTCQLDGGAYSSCSSPVSYPGLAAGSHTVNVMATDSVGKSTTQGTTWVIYTYAWTTGSFGTCSAAQPSWSTGAWGTCSVAQPAYTYDAWGTCSVTCGGGTQTRNETCPIVSGGTQTRSVSCPLVGGAQTRTVQCERNDSTIVSDTYCDAGTKPDTSQACSRGGGSDCSGVEPDSSQSCSRGGGTDCSGADVTSQTCNPQACP